VKAQLSHLFQQSGTTLQNRKYAKFTVTVAHT